MFNAVDMNIDLKVGVFKSRPAYNSSDFIC